MHHSAADRRSLLHDAFRRHLTIDIDGLDPSLVAQTGTPEPGGLGWYETIGLIRTLARKKRVVGMDLTEYSYVEGFDASAFLQNV